MAGSNKGDVKQGDLFNNPFALGAMTEGRMNYTSEKVVELVPAEATSFTPAWTPVVGDKVIGIAADGTETELTLVNGSVAIAAGAFAKIKYVYDNRVIPQDDLPIYNAKVEGIALRAKARRIAVYYSQMAAFQAKQEMGMDLGEVLSTQACAELTHEIDAEIVECLHEGALYEWTKVGDAFVKGALRTDVVVFDKRVPVGVSKAQHYEGFLETLEEMGNIVYAKTQKHNINYVVCARDVINVVSFIEGWKPSNAKPVGPYYAGNLNGIKFYVSPKLAKGEMFAGFHGDDLMTSAAIYAPYMALVPTMLLGYADGGMSQGFSTLYDLKLLNPILLVPGKVVSTAPEADETHAVING